MSTLTLNRQPASSPAVGTPSARRVARALALPTLVLGLLAGLVGYLAVAGLLVLVAVRALG